MPRYCLFGDTVNTASRIESSSEAQMVQISEMTKNMLNPNDWDIYERGTIQLKGKGFMKTYWLYGRHSKDQISDGSTGDDITHFDTQIERLCLSAGSQPLTLAINRRTSLLDKSTNKSLLPVLSMTNAYSSCKQLNDLMHFQLAKQLSLSDGINTATDNNKIFNYSAKNNEKNSSLLAVEGHNQSVAAIDRLNTINNSLVTNRENRERVECEVDGADGGQGCFKCQKAKSNGANSRARSQTSCNVI